MNSQYNIIFSIQVIHEYFEKGICKNIKIQPNKAFYTFVIQIF